jgi:hypothetical protein
VVSSIDDNNFFFEDNAAITNEQWLRRGRLLAGGWERVGKLCCFDSSPVNKW